MEKGSRPILWHVTDPRGLNIILAKDSWDHAILKHRELADYLFEVRQTLVEPDAIFFDPKSTEEHQSGAQIYWYMKRGILSGPLQKDHMSVIVKVVVESYGKQGYVSTAIPLDKPMTRLVLEWSKS